MSGGVQQLTGIEVEHLISDVTLTGMVKVRAIGEDDTVVGSMTPADARQVAHHLMESAARAEYEQDLWSQMCKAEWTDDMIGGIMAMVRTGEMMRHTETPQ